MAVGAHIRIHRFEALERVLGSQKDSSDSPQLFVRRKSGRVVGPVAMMSVNL